VDFLTSFLGNKFIDVFGAYIFNKFKRKINKKGLLSLLNFDKNLEIKKEILQKTYDQIFLNGYDTEQQRFINEVFSWQTNQEIMLDILFSATNNYQNLIEKFEIPFEIKTEKLVATFRNLPEQIIKLLIRNKKEALSFDTTITLSEAHNGVNIISSEIQENTSKILLEIDCLKDSIVSEILDKHIDTIKESQTKKYYYKYLQNVISNNRIGFDDSENLKYQGTYAKWMDTDNYDGYHIAETGDRSNTEFEEGLFRELNDQKDLKKIEDLLNVFMQFNKDEFIASCLILADFGKGKSVFMKHIAASYAKDIIEEKEPASFFPIYVNLREVKSIQNTVGLETAYQTGSIKDIIPCYLRDTYNIYLDDLFFDNKNILFIFDSFDEAGVNYHILSALIKSIFDHRKSMSKYRMIIASRPLNDFLVHINQLQENPYYEKVNYGGVLTKVGKYIYLYGFKKKQFNDFIESSLKKTGFQYLPKYPYDLYNYLLEKNILEESELRKPLFAYIIYKLLAKNINITTLDKTELFLIFINQLTIEAKYIKDSSLYENYNEKTIKPTLMNQIYYRTVLQYMAVLWIMNRSNFKDKNDDLIKMKKKNILELLGIYNKDELKLSSLKFLSHSYFGENNDEFVFKHQSFAEILLAEYYIKVFISFGLRYKELFYDKIPEIKCYLKIGLPTSLSVRFIERILPLLEKSISSSSEGIRARIILFPLIASMASFETDTLFIKDLYENWYIKCKYELENNIEVNANSCLIKNWPITQDLLNNIVEICVQLIKECFSENKVNSDFIIMQKKLSDKDLIKKSYDNEDIWLSLVVGNILFNDTKIKKYFSSLLDTSALFSIIRPLSDNEGVYNPAILWGNKVFMGFDMRNSSIMTDSIYTHRDFSGFDFSCCYFKDFYGFMIDFKDCIFKETSFDGFELEQCNLTNAVFDEVNIICDLSITTSCSLSPNLIFPDILSKLLYFPFKPDLIIIPTFLSDGSNIDALENIKYLLKWVIKERKISCEYFVSCFQTTNNKLSEVLKKYIEKLYV
jgi:uncharacterized protein YjbI with pentapeptide repeats